MKESLGKRLAAKGYPQVIFCGGMMVVLFIAVPIILAEFRDWSLESRCRSFQSTTGQIVSVTVEQRMGGGSNTSGENYAALPEYEYEVDGVTYRNSRKRPFEDIYSHAIAEVEAEELRATTTIEVFFNPADPQDSLLFLDSGKHATDNKAVAIGFTLFLSLGVLTSLVLIMKGIRKFLVRT